MDHHSENYELADCRDGKTMLGMNYEVYSVNEIIIIYNCIKPINDR